MAEIQWGIKAERGSFGDLNCWIEEFRTIFTDLSKKLRNEFADINAVATLIMEWEKGVKELDDNEKKLIDEFNQVFSNLYLLPGYVLAVTTGVSGLLSSDPHFCWLLGNVIITVVIYLTAMWLAIRFAYRQLLVLQAKTQKLVVERDRLYQSFQTHINTLDEDTRSTIPPLLEKLQSYEIKNSQLEFQAKHYNKFLLLITVGGLLYAFMLLVTGYHVLCSSKSVSLSPCTPSLHQAVPVEPVLRLHQDM